jgi:hypothetical protein
MRMVVRGGSPQSPKLNIWVCFENRWRLIYVIAIKMMWPYPSLRNCIRILEDLRQCALDMPMCDISIISDFRYRSIFKVRMRTIDRHNAWPRVTWVLLVIAQIIVSLNTNYAVSSPDWHEDRQCVYWFFLVYRVYQKVCQISGRYCIAAFWVTSDISTCTRLSTVIPLRLF